jgi:hypothetical protein
MASGFVLSSSYFGKQAPEHLSPPGKVSITAVAVDVRRLQDYEIRLPFFATPWSSSPILGCALHSGANLTGAVGPGLELSKQFV